MILKLSSPMLHCDECLRKLKKALKKVKDIEVKLISLETKEIILKYNEDNITETDILNLLINAKYPSIVIE